MTNKVILASSSCYVSNNPSENQKNQHCLLVNIVLKIIALVGSLFSLIWPTREFPTPITRGIVQKPSTNAEFHATSCSPPAPNVFATNTSISNNRDMFAPFIPSTLASSTTKAEEIQPNKPKQVLPSSLTSPKTVDTKPRKSVNDLSQKCRTILDARIRGKGGATVGLNQLREFEQQKRFHAIRNNHYDWWLFPINMDSQFGDKYNISDQECESLIAHPGFIDSYIEGISIVLNGWGWKDGKYDESIEPGDSSRFWNGYGVRLNKMAHSLLLFIKNSKGENTTRLVQTYKDVQQFYLQVVLPQNNSKKQICHDLKYVQMYCDPLSEETQIQTIHATP